MGRVPEVTSGTVHLGHEAAAKTRPGGVEGTQLPLCTGVMPVREAPSPGLKLNRDQ